MIVNYFPENVEHILRDTAFGLTLFEADFMLKAYGLNKDPFTGREISSKVARYRSELDYALEELLKSVRAGSYRDQSGPVWHRLWFEPFMRVMHSTEGLTMVLDNPVMVVRTEHVEFDAHRRPIRNLKNLESPPAARRFASLMTRLFTAFAEEQVHLRRLLELAKLVKFARWIYDIRIPVDYSSLDSYPVAYQQTPRTVPTATVTKGFDFGWMRYYTSLYGGVNLIKRNDYASKNAIQVKTTTSSPRPRRGFTTWPIEVDGYQYVAASVSPILGVR